MSEPPSLAQRRILVVEASAASRYRLRLELERAGGSVQLADSAERALAQIREARPDAVVTGAILPGINGLELLQLLKADPATGSIDVIIRSADRRWPLAGLAQAHGARAVLGPDETPHRLAALLAQPTPTTPATRAAAPGSLPSVVTAAATLRPRLAKAATNPATMPNPTGAGLLQAATCRRLLLLATLVGCGLLLSVLFLLGGWGND